MPTRSGRPRTRRGSFASTPATNATRTIDVDELGHAAEPAADDAAVWVAGPVLTRGADGGYELTGNSRATRLDPATLEPLAQVEPARGLLALVAGGEIRAVDLAGTWFASRDRGLEQLDGAVPADEIRVVTDGSRAWVLDASHGRIALLRPGG